MERLPIVTTLVDEGLSVTCLFDMSGIFVYLRRFGTARLEVVPQVVPEAQLIAEANTHFENIDRFLRSGFCSQEYG